MGKTDERKWFNMWFEDKESILGCMINNLQADLEAGYRMSSNCIQKQIKDIEQYRQKMQDQLDDFIGLDDKKVERWCYYDLKKRGAI